MLIGYARVSTRDQRPDLQMDALREAGCERVFQETVSGAKRDRPELKAAVDFMRIGDTLVVWKLDRLARSTRQLLETVEDFEQRGIGLKTITQNIDTTNAGGRLIFTVFSAIAEFEREIIRERTLAGLDASRSRGRKGGRPRALTEKDLENEPKSPDGFWPSMEDTSVSSETRLANLKEELDRIHKSWTKSLLADLADPVIQSHFDLLKPSQKKMLKDFMGEKEIPDDISQEFLTAIQQALSGLAKLPVRLDDLKKILFPDGSPATPAEFKQRFADYLEQLLKGRDTAKVRLVIE
jgi:succinate dehydrogenase flavin-adding protein (antitoxin of CptAB toxin-antitoxin module)